MATGLLATAKCRAAPGLGQRPASGVAGLPRREGLLVSSKTRTCTECKRPFATPDSLRLHKRVDGACRSEEALQAVGFSLTPTGWVRKGTPLFSRRNIVK